MDEVEPLMRRALAIDEKSFGPEHPKVAIRLNNLAMLFQDTNRLKEAEPLMRHALAINEKSFGPEHPEVARCLNNLALLFYNSNRIDEAEPLMRRAVGIIQRFREKNGHEHSDWRTYRSNYHSLLKAMGVSSGEIEARLREEHGAAGPERLGGKNP